MGLYRTAASCFGGMGEHRGGRLVLSLFFKAALGIQRIFHFDSLNDVGLALLTGGRRTLSRSTLGQRVRTVSSQAVGRFVRLTLPVVAAAQRLHVSIDEHAVARFTRKFLIPKGFHTMSLPRAWQRCSRALGAASAVLSWRALLPGFRTAKLRACSTGPC